MARPRTLDQLVEQHIRHWELDKRKGALRRPCVAISRYPFSGGELVAAAVAKELEYQLFNIELLDYIAQEQHLQRAMLETLDERVRPAVERLVVDAFRTGVFRESDYLRCVVRAVTTIAQRGAAVLVGRGAPYIVEPAEHLRVLVVADAAQRADQLGRAEGLEMPEARRRLAEVDLERREFLGQFGVDPDQPSLYDLVVNASTLGIEACTRHVLDALRDLSGAGRQDSPTPGSRGRSVQRA